MVQTKAGRTQPGEMKEGVEDGQTGGYGAVEVGGKSLNNRFSLRPIAGGEPNQERHMQFEAGRNGRGMKEEMPVVVEEILAMV